LTKTQNVCQTETEFQFY